MRARQPYGPDDLQDLDDRLLSQAFSVIAMQEVFAGNRHSDVIAMRHDVDDKHALATAANMAEWEAARGYRSTYYVLHSSPYWGTPEFPRLLDRIASSGHEIGMHANALAESFRQKRDPDMILDEALATLRGYGYPVRGVVGHGDGLCNRDAAQGEGWFANDEQFVECARPKDGLPDREITRGNITRKLRPRPLSDFGFDYEVVRLGRGSTNTDSGGKWYYPFDQTVAEFAAMTNGGSAARAAKPFGQLHMLVHPDWWQQAFTA
jgi:hypothetical protein